MLVTQYEMLDIIRGKIIKCFVLANTKLNKVFDINNARRNHIGEMLFEKR